jgi:hypothetical protein
MMVMIVWLDRLLSGFTKKFNVVIPSVVLQSVQLTVEGLLANLQLAVPVCAWVSASNWLSDFEFLMCRDLLARARGKGAQAEDRDDRDDRQSDKAYFSR